MRDIKFMAWNTIGRKMHPESDWAYEWHMIKEQHESGLIVLLQYTGLKDKDGVEIYEGDVLTFDWRMQGGSGELYAADCENIKGEIAWLDGKFIVRFFSRAMSFDLSEVNQFTFERFWKESYHGLKDEYYKMTGFKVIGNIYENPELLGD